MPERVTRAAALVIKMADVDEDLVYTPPPTYAVDNTVFKGTFMTIDALVEYANNEALKQGFALSKTQSTSKGTYRLGCSLSPLRVNYRRQTPAEHC